MSSLFSWVAVSMCFTTAFWRILRRLLPLKFFCIGLKTPKNHSQHHIHQLEYVKNEFVAHFSKFAFWLRLHPNHGPWTTSQPWSMGRHKELSNTNSESPQKMLSGGMLRFVFVYDAQFADALASWQEVQAKKGGSRLLTDFLIRLYVLIRNWTVTWIWIDSNIHFLH